MKIIGNKKSIIAVLLFTIAIFVGVAVYADSFVSPVPQRIESEDGSRVFIFNPLREENYPAMGVYFNNETMELIYAINLGSMVFENDFIFSSDFQYFVFIPTVNAGDLGPDRDGAALEFYRNGVLLRRYMVSELVANMDRVGFSVSMAHWHDWASRGFNGIDNTFTVTTNDHIRYVFDITTGEFIKNERLMHDPPSAWAAEQVAAAVSANLVPQNLQSRFTQPITRAEFAALAVELYETVTGKEVAGRMSFNDTDDINVEKIGYLGVVTGVGGGNFNPNDSLTREQAAVMLTNLAEAIGNPLPLWLMGLAPNVAIADYDHISSWAVGSVEQIYATGIMSGIGGRLFAPQNPYTREQSIVTIMRLFDMVN